MFGVGENKKDVGPEDAYAKANVDAKKTTPDEGKAFEKDTIFVCTGDCFRRGVRYRKGDEIEGRTCPPWFRVKPDVKPGETNRKDNKK